MTQQHVSSTATTKPPPPNFGDAGDETPISHDEYLSHLKELARLLNNCPRTRQDISALSDDQALMDMLLDVYEHHEGVRTLTVHCPVCCSDRSALPAEECELYLAAFDLMKAIYPTRSLEKILLDDHDDWTCLGLALVLMIRMHDPEPPTDRADSQDSFYRGFEVVKHALAAHNSST